MEEASNGGVRDEPLDVSNGDGESFEPIPQWWRKSRMKALEPKEASGMSIKSGGKLKPIR